MALPQGIKLPRGQMKCNQCRKACQIKSGDWFFAADSSGGQIFLCQVCESAAKGSFKKVSESRASAR